MIGQTISHYRTLSRIGGGGMGAVYACGAAVPRCANPNLVMAVLIWFLPASFRWRRKIHSTGIE
jgi:hypothetical protein